MIIYKKTKIDRLTTKRQSGLAEPHQAEPNRTVPNIGRTEQRSCSFPDEHEPKRTVAPYVRFVWMFCSPGYEPNPTGVSNVRVRFVFGSFGSVSLRAMYFY